MKHRIKYQDASHALTTDLDVGLGVATTASVCLKDEDGAHLLNGTITGVTDAGGGTCTFAYTGHAVAVGDVVTVAGTTSYNAAQTVTAVASGTFDATETYVASEAGTYEITAAKATILTATTLGAAATRGKGSITLASVTSLVEGYPLRLAMSADGGDEDVIIAAVNTSTKVCELTDYLRFDHTSGAAVTGRRLSYALDASQSDFTSGLDFNVIWELTDTDDPAWRENAEVLKREVAFSGLAQKFKTLYGHYFTAIPDGEFEAYQDAAYNELRLRVSGVDGQDLDKLVNADELEPSLARKIMYNIAWTGDDSWEKERIATKMLFDDSWVRFLKARNWIDADQDDVKGDSETQPMLRPLPRRNLY